MVNTNNIPLFDDDKNKCYDKQFFVFRERKIFRDSC